MTYADQIQTYVNFKTKEEMDQHFNALRKKVRFQLTKADNEILFMLKQRAAKHPGAAKIALDTLTAAVTYSTATIKRAIKKGVELGFIKRFNQRKQNGRRKGVTVYQFQRHDALLELQHDPQTMSCRGDVKNPCGSKREEVKKDTYTPFSLNASSSFKDTFITGQGPDTAEQARKKLEEKQRQEQALKDALLAKLPDALRVLGLFINERDAIFNIAGTIFNAKNKIDKTLRIEQHDQAFRKKIISVMEYWKRNVIGDDTYEQLGKIMRKAIYELTRELINGEAASGVPEDTAVNGVTQAMIDATEDVFEKQRLIDKRNKKQHKTGRTEMLPHWFKQHEEMDNNTQAIEQAQEDPTTEELEAAYVRIAALLGMTYEEYKAHQQSLK